MLHESIGQASLNSKTGIQYETNYPTHVIFYGSWNQQFKTQ